MQCVVFLSRRTENFLGLSQRINDYIKNVAEDQSLNYEKFKKEMIKVSKNGG